MTKPYNLPIVTLKHLDSIWIQVSGTLCNYQCSHCFISCHPKNHTLEMLSVDRVRRIVEEGVRLGVKEFYYTGGEPFLHPHIVEILEHTLRFGPATVLTNASVLQDRWLERLAEAEARSTYSLEFRVSLDGFTEPENDAIRGKGTFRRTLRGVERLVRYGFLPIITAVRTWPEEKEAEVVKGFVELLRSIGYTRPRLKIVPVLRLGAEVSRTRDYEPGERVTAEMLEGFDLSHLLCSSSRTVTSRGVSVCPILVEKDDMVLGDSLSDSLRPFALVHGACWTCYQYGTICSNASQREPEKVAMTRSEG